jgi:trans-aconitate methyltransferase
MSADELPRLYRELASWWSLLSPPAEYDDEAADLLRKLAAGGGPTSGTLLELGAGGGSLASHLKRRFTLTLTDKSPAMLDVSRTVNPECEHLVGDMRSLRLPRSYDVVLVHDAITYATDPDTVRAVLRTAAVHCRSGGIVAILPDHVRETFQGGTEHGGHDAPDGRALRYLEWTWDPDPTDTTYTVDYVFLLRTPDGAVAVEHERHIEGLFSRAEWLEWLAEAGFRPGADTDEWGRVVFTGIRTGRQA